ncbi:MAG: hypothetical protein AAF849_20750 [Bacteroidota bacterium]
MVKSQLIELLRTFDKREIRECKKWLKSPFHNQRQDVIDLYEYIFTRNNLHNDKKLRKEKVFAVLFPKEDFDDAKIRQTMYFLLKSLEDYLIFSRNKEEEVRNRILLAEIYREEKQLNKLAAKSLESAKNQLDKEKIKNLDFQWNEYLMKREEVDFLESGRFEGNQALVNAINAHDRYYIATRFRDLCIIHNKQSEISPFENLLVPVLSKYAESLDPEKFPAVFIYYNLYQMLTGKQEDQFLKFREKLIKYRENFSDEDKQNIFLLVINHCIRQMNSGKRQYLKEAFSFYKIGIEDKFLIQNGSLDRYLFRNIVSAGVSLREFSWVDNFIKEYQKYLEEEYRESFVNFCFGLLYYRSSNYDQAMRYLAQYEHDDILLNLNSKAMLIKIYYEQEEIMALESLLESAKVYLRRKKGVSESYRIAYDNIIKYTKKLLRVNPYDKAKRIKLREEIQAANPLIEKQWFLDQLEQL